MTALPLAKTLLKQFEKGSDFHASQIINNGKGARLVARANGVPVIADLNFLTESVVFLSVEGIQAAEPSTLTTRFDRNKARAVMENELARERIEDHCLDCEHFRWSGLIGPVCAKAQGQGCQCVEFVDPAWKCPIGNW